MTKAEVTAAMETLIARGEEPSIKRIRAVLGRGSYEDISSLRQQVLAERGAEAGEASADKGDGVADKLQTGLALKLIEQLQSKGVPMEQLGKELHQRYNVSPHELAVALNTPEAHRLVDPELHDRLMTNEYLTSVVAKEPIRPAETPVMEEPQIQEPTPDPRRTPLTLTPHQQAYVDAVEAHMNACQLCQRGRLHHWMCVFDGHWFSYGSRLPFTRGFISLTADKSLGGYAINGCSEAHVDQWSQLEEAPEMAQTSQQRADYERKINALRRTGGLGIAR